MHKELHHLFKAIKEHKLDQVKVAIKNEQSIVNYKDDKGQTALTEAAEYGTTAIIDHLVKHGAHIDYQLPPHNFTPLIIALNAGQFDNAKYLIDAGASKHALDVEGKNALWHAQKNKNQDIIILLQETKL